MEYQYWESADNIRIFLDRVSLTIGIKTPSDWGHVTNQRFMELGGSSLLNQKLSLKNILRIYICLFKKLLRSLRDI